MTSLSLNFLFCEKRNFQRASVYTGERKLIGMNGYVSGDMEDPRLQQAQEGIESNIKNIRPNSKTFVRWKCLYQPVHYISPSKK